MRISPGYLNKCKRQILQASFELECTDVEKGDGKKCASIALLYLSITIK